MIAEKNIHGDINIHGYIKRINQLLLTLMLTMLLAGCSSSRSSSRKQLPSQLPADIGMQTPSQRFGEVCKTYGAWIDVQLPLKLSLVSPRSMNVSAKAAMRRGEWIDISVRMLGFEVASVFITPDSIHAVDRYHKAYLSEGLSRVLGNSGATLQDLQDLLTGRAFLVGEPGGTLSPQFITAFDLTSTPEGLMLLPARQPTAFNYGFVLSPDANRVGASTVAVGSHAATFLYASPVSTGQAGEFAEVVRIDLNHTKPLSAQLDWDFKSAKWNSGLQRQWKQPQGYTRLDAGSLLSKLTRL